MFGISPQRLPTQVSAYLAAQAAVEALELTRQLNRRRTANSLPPLEIAIGISTGTVAGRGDPGIPSGGDGPGEAVEAAGDLQRYAKTIAGSHLLVGESVFRCLAGAREQFRFGSQMSVRVQSPAGEGLAYELLGRVASLTDPDIVEAND
jgi:class 3 adenylate cyclase